MDFQELKTRLLPLDTACVCDANKALRAADSTINALRVADPTIRPIRTGLKLFGRAHTVRCHNDFLAVIRGLRDAVADDVLVVDSQGSDRAVSGSLFPTEAIRKGLAGIVVDGFGYTMFFVYASGIGIPAMLFLLAAMRSKVFSGPKVATQILPN